MRKIFKITSTPYGNRGLYMRDLITGKYALVAIFFSLKEEEVWKRFLRSRIHWDED